MENSKRILEVRILHLVDEDPDTSYYGEYSQKRTSEFSIDRAHSLECNVNLPISNSTICEYCSKPRSEHEIVWFSTLPEYRCHKDTEEDQPDDIFSPVECDCDERGDMQRNEYRYFNPSFNYVDKNGNLLPDNTPEEVRKYVREDYHRMESLHRGRWYYIGIRAEADIEYPAYGGVPPAEPTIVQTKDTLSSMGLWGIESNSGEYLQDIEKDQLSQLKTELTKLGFSQRAISTAFKEIVRKDE